MQTSRNGLLFIAQREALVLVAYPDGRNHAIGFGHNSSSVLSGDVVTVSEAFDLLKEDAASREPQINKWLKVPVTQPQFDALLSLYYEYGLRKGGDDVRSAINFINSGDPTAAEATMKACDTDSMTGKVIPGLLVRRQAEIQLFRDGDYGPTGTVQLWRGNPRTTKSENYVVQDGDLA
jgi:lysozyme